MVLSLRGRPMLKTSHRLYRLGKTALVTVSASLMAGTTIANWVSPACADMFITGGYFYPQGQQTPSTMIYGSPIPAPMPVNSVTGSLTSSTSYDKVYPGYYGRVTGGVVDSTLINPTVVNSPIYNSTLINPTIIDSSRYPRTRYPRTVIGVPVYPRTIIRGSFGISY